MKDRAYKIARNLNYDGYQTALAGMAYKFFDKKTGSGVSVNEELAKEIHKPIIKNFKKKKKKEKRLIPSKDKKGKKVIFSSK